MSTAIVVYLCFFLAGFLFLLISFLFGAGHDSEMDHDPTWEEVADGHEVSDQTISPSIFSAKVAACFLIGFGLGATISYYWLSDAMLGARRYFLDSLCGLMGGLIVGYLGWLIIKTIMSQQGSYQFTLDKLVGARAVLSVSIPPNGIGELVHVLDGQRRVLDVRTPDGSPLPHGTLVEVVGISGSHGLVKPVA